MILIGILIFLLTILLSWQIIAAVSSVPFSSVPFREGLESAEPVPETDVPASASVYQPYNTDALSNNAAALPKQNATNIDYLNGQMLGLTSSNTKNQQSINAMQTQIDSLTEQQVKYSQSIGTPEPTTEITPETPEEKKDEEGPITASVNLMVKIAQKLDFKKKYRLADKLTYIIRKKI